MDKQPMLLWLALTIPGEPVIILLRLSGFRLDGKEVDFFAVCRCPGGWQATLEVANLNAYRFSIRL